MYDFYLGSPEEIATDETRYLVAIKRMLPRWVNSMPDSEFVAIARLLDEQGVMSKDPVFVETGAGASTLAFAFYAMKHGGTAYSWEVNSAKGSVIRQACTETMSRYFGMPVDAHWQLVAFNSLSPHLGLPTMRELENHVDLFFHDSEHTWETVRGELGAVMSMLSDGSVVALDDANLDWLHTNLGYVNTFRRKLGLPNVEEPEGNRCERFYVQTERLLRERFDQVDHLPDLYKERYASDPYFAYYDAEFEIKAGFGTERSEDLDHRFDSWRVAGRRDEK